MIDGQLHAIDRGSSHRVSRYGSPARCISNGVRAHRETDGDGVRYPALFIFRGHDIAIPDLYERVRKRLNAGCMDAVIVRDQDERAIRAGRFSHDSVTLGSIRKAPASHVGDIGLYGIGDGIRQMRIAPYETRIKVFSEAECIVRH